MRTQECYGPIYPGLSRHFHDFYIGFSQWFLRLDLRPCFVILHDVLHQPALEELLAFDPGHEATELVAHDRLEVVREAGYSHNVLQLRGEARARACRWIVVFLRL